MAPEDPFAAAASPAPPRTTPPPVGAAVIPIVNRLQDIFAQLGGASTIDLPQVAVVGSQSSGKSSVLEALVGRDFLPRGADICTRRPLVLQLVQLPQPEPGGAPAVEWGEFLHRPGDRFEDFSEVRREIERETDRIAGAEKGVSDKQIRLKIFSPNVLNITLVDLPGLTKVPVGNQPSDIEARIRTMIHSYIKHKTCIILAVSPANSDLANSDALQMARNADPDGSRTIGVITKLDIMDKGTNAANYLLGKVVPLRLGYVGVVNRSKQDIDDNKSIAEALVNEENFFRHHSVYHAIADRCGIPQLARKLNQILVLHIKMVLPGLKARLNAQMADIVKELHSYGEIADTVDERRVVLLNILTKYCEAFSSMIDGKYHEMCTTELSGGARIHYIFQSIFVEHLDKIDPCEDLTDDEIRTAIHNATGTRIALFVPEVPFEVLVRRRIARLLDPSVQCLRFVYDELIKISHACQTIDMQRFPVLGKRLEEVLIKFLRDGKRPAERMIMNIIEMEMDYINTSHPNFIGGSKAVELALQQRRVQKLAMDTATKKDSTENERLMMSEKSQKARGFFSRPSSNGVLSEQGERASTDKQTSTASTQSSGSWGISSIFGGNDQFKPQEKDSLMKTSFGDSTIPDPPFSIIQLQQPPSILKPSAEQTENEFVEIAVTRMLLRSYYEIVRKNIQDYVPKAIMHFLVNHAKRDLLSNFIQKLYREELLNILLNEREEVAIKRQQTREMYHVLQQALCTLDELPVDLDEVSNSSSGNDISLGLPRFGTSDRSTGNGDTGTAYRSPQRSTRKHRSTHSGTQPSLANGAPEYYIPES